MIFLFGAAASTVKSQDLIVRIYGDTLSGKVDKEDARFVYYRTIHTKKGETEIISLKEVAEIIYGGDVSASRKPKEKRLEKSKEVEALLIAMASCKMKLHWLR